MVIYNTLYIIYSRNIRATILTICLACLAENTGEMTRSRCTFKSGGTSNLQQLMNSSTEVTWQFSLTACAILCEKQKCVSYSYDPFNNQCVTRNVNTKFPGYLCGLAVDQARLRCNVKGEAYVAFGGKYSTAMQCVCGTDRQATRINWIVHNNTPSYDCVNTCTGRPCVIKVGLFETCGVCNGDENICKPVYSLNNVYASICTPIA